MAAAAGGGGGAVAGGGGGRAGGGAVSFSARSAPSFQSAGSRQNVDSYSGIGITRPQFRNGGNSTDNKRDRRNNRGNNTVVVYSDSGSGYGYGYYPPWYRLDYGTNTPSPVSSSPFNIPLNTNFPSDVTYAPAPPPPAAGNSPDRVQGDLIVAVQRELRRRGFYLGAVNGVSDAGTRAAIRSYEASIGAPVTGQVGMQLMRTLGFF